MKVKTLELILLVQLIASNIIMVNLASAQNRPTIKVEPASFTAPMSYVNETFSINITINDVDAALKVIGVQFRLRYNETLLEVVDVVEGSFLADPRWNLYETFFVYFVERDVLYGPHVLVGNTIFPNTTNGEYDQTQFPQGNGTIATITFKEKYQPVEPEPPASCVLELIDTMVLDADGNEIPHTIQNGYYEVESLPVPILTVKPDTYYASKIGEVFNISVDINNVDARWHLIGVQFRLRYNTTLLKVVDVVEGPFLADPRWNLYGTFFVNFTETDGLYGPHVLVGNMIFPNTTNGEYDQTQFPQGNGTIATITFNATKQTTVEPEPPANCTLKFIEAMLINDQGEELPFNTTSGFYQIPPLRYPIPAFSYEPVAPSIGEIVIFDASKSYDPDYKIATYSWDFGDRTTVNTTEPVIGHVYSLQGTFNVTLTVTDIGGLSANLTKIISVGYYEELAVNIDVGSMHFAGELADFYVLTSDFGRRIDATNISALLYYNGKLIANLTDVIQHIDTGLYMIAYQIPANATAGTYTLVVEAECYNVKGTNLKSFLISSTLSGFVTDITQGIATVSNGLTEVKVNLTAINAKLVSIEGKIGIINSTLGTLGTDIATLNVTLTNLIVNSEHETLANVTTSLNTLTVKLDAIDAKIVGVNGTVATISTTLGEANVKLGDVQSIATTALYVTSILSAIAVILAAIILLILRKK